MNKPADSRLLLWLLKQVRPYWLLVAAALVSLFVSTSAELINPVVMQQTIDQYINPVYVRIDEANYVLENRRNGRKSLDGEIRYLLISRSEEELVEDLQATIPEIKQTATHIALDSHEVNKLPEELRQSVNAYRFRGISKKGLQYLLLLAVILIGTFSQVFFTTWLGQNVMRDIRLTLHKHLLRQSLRYHHEKPVGSLVSRLINDVETINEFFTNVAADLFKDISVMIGVLVVLFYLSPVLALVTILSLPPVAVATLYFRTIIRQAYRKMREQVSKVNAFLSERIAGMEIVQIFAQDERTRDEFDLENTKLLKASLKEMRVMARFRPLTQLFTSISIAMIVYYGSGMILKGTISIGVLIAFINLIEKFYQPVRSISEKFNIIQSAMTGVERIHKLLNEIDEIEDKGHHEAAQGEAGHLEFRNVAFKYKNDPVLRNISFTVEKGQTVAIVGTTGSGKTTIASLITRFWDIQEGEILLDGINIQNYSLRSLRTKVQPVQQDIFLFGGTIRNNILLNADVSTEELNTILEHSQASWFTNQLENGLDSEIKERGSNFSTGQKQLLSFARTMAQKPDVLILDESTGNIDTVTESYIQKGMESLLKNRTALVIAHRLSTIKNADRILVLDKGTIAEEGTHEELLQKEGMYYKLYKLQFSTQDINTIQESL